MLTLIFFDTLRQEERADQQRGRCHHVPEHGGSRARQVRSIVLCTEHSDQETDQKVKEDTQVGLQEQHR